VVSEGMGESKMEDEVDEETKGADSRDKVKHSERSDQLFLERMMKVAELE